MSSKLIAGAILILMNVLFAYYSVLFGFIQGIAWQRKYVFACVVQMIVEVFINETLEVVWMRFCVPSLVVSAEMRKVVIVIEGIIDRLCDFSPPQQSSQDTTAIPILINAPEYLFVSTKVAKSFPHLMESILIRTFITHLPGEVSKLWLNRSSWFDIKLAAERGVERGTHVLRRISTSVTLILAAAAMQLIGAAPYELQRMVVRLLQPFFFSGIILVYFMVINSAVNVSLFAGVLCLAVAYLVLSYIRDGIAIRNKLLHAVHPLHTTNDKEFAAADPIIDLTSIKENVSIESSIFSEGSVESSLECKDEDASISPDSIEFSEVSSGTSNGSSDYGSVSDDNESTGELT
jgi:hypothetical protein